MTIDTFTYILLVLVIILWLSNITLTFFAKRRFKNFLRTLPKHEVYNLRQEMLVTRDNDFRWPMIQGQIIKLYDEVLEEKK